MNDKKTSSTSESESTAEFDDLAVTGRVERVEPEPAPLPPSPGDNDARGWFDRQPTYTVPKPKLKPLPQFGTGVGTGVGTSTGDDPTGVRDRPALPRTRNSRGFLLLVIVTSAAVGMVVGALLYGWLVPRNSTSPAECPPISAPR